MKKLLSMMFFIPLLSWAVSVHAGAPLEAVKANVKDALEILRDPKLSADSAKEMKKEKLRSVYSNMFNEEQFSRRALARNWSRLNEPQQREFTRLFRQVLEKSYMDKILAYTNEEILFDRETMLSENQAEVFTRIKTPSREIPISYRLVLENHDWKVYDVTVENVSLVQNYRSQFNAILAKNSPQELLEILREKARGI